MRSTNLLILVFLLSGCKQIANMKILWLPKVVFFLIGAIFGSGGLWSLLRHRYQQKTYVLEETKLSSELRNDLSDKLIKLIQKSERYADVKEGKVKVAVLSNELSQLNSQIELLKSDIVALEERLAKIERREPRDIKLKFVPPEPPKWTEVEDVTNST